MEDLDELCKDLRMIGVISTYPSFMDRDPVNSLEKRIQAAIKEHGLQALNECLKERRAREEWGMYELMQLFDMKITKLPDNMPLRLFP